jgi:AI-2 transport protein TqsA
VREERPPRAIPVEGGEPVPGPPAFDWAKVREMVDQNIQALGSVEFDRVLSVGTDVVGRVFTFFGTAFVILILTVFMLTEARMFGRRFEAICDARGPNFQRMLSATRDIQRYLGIKTLISLATGVLAGLLCWAAGLDFFLLWGIVAFTMNYIPVVGSIIAGVPPMMLAMLDKGMASGVAVAGGYVLINVLLGNFIEPMLMGRRFGLSTLVVVLSVLFWGWLWGPIGMLLAVPLTMMLKVVLDNSEDFRWIAVAISKEQVKPAEEQRILRSGVVVDPGDEGDEAPGRA